jgi:hypothetical protein
VTKQLDAFVENEKFTESAVVNNPLFDNYELLITNRECINEAEVPVMAGNSEKGSPVDRNNGF